MKKSQSQCKIDLQNPNQQDNIIEILEDKPYFKIFHYKLQPQLDHYQPNIKERGEFWEFKPIKICKDY